MTVLCGILTALVVMSWAYWTLALIAAWRFRRCREPQSAGSVPVTILKPLCGMEHGLRENLASYLNQEYPVYQVVFVVEDANDPALETARSVLAGHPNVDGVAICGSAAHGTNRKVANLVHALQWARHPIVVVSDSDMRVRSGYLRAIASWFDDPRIGIVTCLYRVSEPDTLAARLEALHVGADFIPSVLAAWLLMGTRFGFGSTLAVRREALERIGGFAPLLDEIADDYRLVERVRGIGYRSALACEVVECPLGKATLAEMWSRRVRWARTIRSLQPLGHLGALVTHGTPLALVLGAICAHESALWPAIATLALRLTLAPLTALIGSRDPAVLRSLPLLWLNDCLGFVIWACSWYGSRVVWRGRAVPLASSSDVLDTKK